MKRLRADDSGCTSVKVGHRQAFIAQNPAASRLAGFCFWGYAQAAGPATGTTAAAGGPVPAGGRIPAARVPVPAGGQAPADIPIF